MRHASDLAELGDFCRMLRNVRYTALGCDVMVLSPPNAKRSWTMRGAMLRKMTVARKIRALPDDTRRTVENIYSVYDRLEFLTVMPKYAFLMFGIIVPFYGYEMAAPPEFGAYGKIAGAAVAAACWVLCCALTWRIFVAPRRSRLRAEITAALDATGRPSKIMEILRAIDPDMVRNAGAVR